MSTPIEPAQIHFNDQGLPISDAFDDIYFSTQDGAAESDYVFLQGNRLAQRFTTWPLAEPFVIAETGFGTGLNMLLTSALFLATAPASAELHLISFERYPLTKADIERALSRWPQLASLCEALPEEYPPLVGGVHRVNLHSRIRLDLHLGDVLETLPSWAQCCPVKVHAWFLDGFAPSKNPQMWQQSLYNAMSRTAAATCTVATFTAVGAVRRGLIQAGFAMTKRAGFGHKREMLIGHKVRPEAPRLSTPARRVAIVGGGIASACVAQLLNNHAKSLDSVTLFCADEALAERASGNAQGAVYPLLQADHTPVTQFYNQAFSFALNFYRRYCASAWHPTGVLQLGFNEHLRKRQHAVVTRTHYPTQLVQAVDAEQASTLSGISVEYPGLFYQNGGWLSPRQAILSMLNHTRTKVMTHTRVTEVQPHSQKRGWTLTALNLATNESFTDHFDDIILANGAELTHFNPRGDGAKGLIIRPVGGQVSQVRSDDDATATADKLKTVLCHKGYLTPAVQGSHCLGATYTKLAPGAEHNYLSTSIDTDNTQSEPAPFNRADDDHANLELTHRYTPLRFSHSATNRRAIRATTPDHLPLVGPHPGYPQRPGVWVLGGLGSRGLTSAPWCAALLIDQIFGRPLAVDWRVKKAIDSHRQTI